MFRTSISLSAARSLLFLMLVLPSLLSLAPASAPQLTHEEVTSSPIDKDKKPSELNHRIAGGFLLAIGVCIIVSERYKSLAWLRWLPPILFIAAGLFLAAWSDIEIWPRGELSWFWLTYDVEARQHKLYAVLLIALGLVEAVQASRTLRRTWLNVAFPVLGVIGGVALLFHHHSGMIVASAAVPSAPASSIVQHIQSDPARSTSHGHEHGDAHAAHPHSSPDGLTKGDTHVAPEGPHHQHHLTGPAAKIQHEHAWFAVVGFCIVLLKLLSNSGKPGAGMRKYLWANAVILLGISLLVYTE